jgi:hypothetical protein
MNVNKISPALKRYTPGDIKKRNLQNYDEEDIKIISTSNNLMEKVKNNEKLTNGNDKNISKCEVSLSTINQKEKPISTTDNINLTNFLIKEQELDLCFDKLIYSACQNKIKQRKVHNMLTLTNWDNIFKNHLTKIEAQSIKIKPLSKNLTLNDPNTEDQKCIKIIHLILF